MKQFAAGLFAAGALAAPLVSRQSTNIDTTVLQFALTLEHLENVFYHEALQKFSLQDFLNAGYSATYYNNLKYISFDEQSHVQLLTSALKSVGATPVSACQYNFPYTDVASFVTLSSVLEGVGVSAYLGGAPLITSKTYLTVAGSILVTEALHTSMQRGAIGEVPMANPYGTPLDPTSVYTLAAAFIKSCPDTGNPALPFKPLPGLSYSPNPACTCEGPDCANYKADKRDTQWGGWSSSAAASSTYYAPAPPAATATKTVYGSGSTVTVTAPGSGSTVYANPGFMGNAPVKSSCSPPTAGQSITLTAASTVKGGCYLTFVSGLSVVSVPATVSGTSVSGVIPSVVEGQSYVFVTNSDQEMSLNSTSILFGPAIVEVAPAPPAIDYSIY